MKYPLIAIPLSALLVLTGCGGSGSGGDDAKIVTPNPPPPPATPPTVKVTAPATAVANVPFDIVWSSTDATSCSSPVFTGSATSGTQSLTETKVGEITYEVTCTGAGGEDTGEATVNVSAQATAEGLWQGTGTGNGGDRTISGVVTKEDKYWLTYSAASNTPLVGFFAGSGTSLVDATGLAGTFPSNDLLEFNFEGAGVGIGGLSLSTFNKAADDKATHSLNATTSATSAPYTFSGEQAYSIDNVTTNCDDGVNPPTCAILTQTPNPPTFDNSSPWNIVPSVVNASTTDLKLIGSFRFQPYVIAADLEPMLGSPLVMTMSFPKRVLSFDSTAGGTLTWDAANRKLKLTGITFNEVSPGYTCEDDGAGLCDIVPTPVVPTLGDVEITYTDANLDHYTGVAHTYQLANAGGGIPGCIGLGGNDWCANGVLTFEGTVPNAQPASQVLTTTYNVAYESAPNLADIAASYTGSAGVETAIQGGATLEIAAGGAVTGTEASGCSYAGTAAPHTSGGNVYDVALTFTAGGTCTYAGPFEGVATYDAETGSITVTAINATSDKGFLFTGTKAL